MMSRRGAWCGAALLALSIAAGPASAGPNRCATSPPSRSPTWVDSLGSHWFDQHGVWTQGPEGSIFGYGGIDLDAVALQASLWANNSVQVYVDGDSHCLIVGDLDALAPPTGEFLVEPAPAIVAMPWLKRDGNLFKAADGRTTILRGVDYPYNEEIFEKPYNLTDADFARIASWGMNVLRVRIANYRSGYLPNHAVEPGYWENLDQLIATANRHGIYVMPSTITGGIEAMVVKNNHEMLKFVKATSNNKWWMAFQAKVFDRYKNWPGVVGFDTINEDNSYPPFIHDQRMMGPAHRQINAILRAKDSRHIYFQEPSGWSYWGAEYWPGMMKGTDIGDPNRFYCPKWKADGDSVVDLETKGKLATQSNVPMFICEYWITKEPGEDDTAVIAQQRLVHAAMDARLIGGVRVLYGPSEGYGTQRADGSEAGWVQEFARPYPVWVGGRPQSIQFDFDARRLTLNLALDGTGATEIFVPQLRMYPQGFEMAASSGERLVHNGTSVVSAAGMSWNAARQRVVLPAKTATVTLILTPP
jgi:hypothetical protein